jgi:hypothetical protein
MKLLQQNGYVLLLILFFASSCQKDSYNLPNAKCLVTHTEEDLYGTALDITYNQKGDPVSLNFSGLTAAVLYDAKNRLAKVNVGTAGVYIDYVYNDNTFLPAVLHYYRPDQGGLISIDSFYYNGSGQMIKRITTNLQRSSYNNVQKFEYNSRGNVKKVTISAYNGGSVFSPAVIAFEASQYDNNYNFMSGNQWIKYVLFYSDMEDYAYLLFSVNNATNWKWGYPGGDRYRVTAAITYDADGFANTISAHYFDTDGITELTSFKRINTSTCDTTAVLKQQKSSTQNKLVQPGRKTNLLKINSR